MTTNTNTDSATLNELLDDLLWLYSRKPGPCWRSGNRCARDDRRVHRQPDHYSDGSPIGAEYIPDYAPNVIVWGPFPPPRRRTAETDTSSRTTTFDRDIMVDALGLCTALHKEATGR